MVAGIVIAETGAWRAYKRAILDRLNRDQSNRPGGINPSDVRTPETVRLFLEWLPLRVERMKNRRRRR